MSEIVSDDVSPLGRLRYQAASLAINSAEGDPIVRLGLITTLYFRHGHTLETKQRIDECFVWFRLVSSAIQSQAQMAVLQAPAQNDAQQLCRLSTQDSRQFA